MKLSNLVLGLTVAASGLVAVAGSSEAFTLNGVGSSISGIDTSKPYVFTFVESNGQFQSNFVVGSKKITETPPGWVTRFPDFGGTCAICSFVSTISGDFALETVAPAWAGTVSSTTNAKFSGTASSFLISWDDRGNGPDGDFNDFVVSARAVPVPAVVPGIALAAAFFGSKALKRNKKNASESVA